MLITKKLHILTVTILLPIFLNGFASAESPEHSGNMGLHTQASTTPIVYASHAPIRINSDLKFTAPNGVIRGNGTASDPYILSGWDINASGSISGIWISNTTAHFVISNCTVHNSSWSDIGIWLENVENGSLKQNKISFNFVGISVEKSQRINISQNNISSNLMYGVKCDRTEMINVSMNEIISNAYQIALRCSNHSTIMFNKVLLGSNTSMEIDCYSRNNFIRGNTIYFNEGDIDCMGSNNSIQSNQVCFNKWGGIGVGYGMGNNLSDNILQYNAFSAVSLGNADSNTLWNNSIISNSTAIVIYESRFNNILKSNISKSSGDGINLNTSEGNTVGWNRICSDGCGIGLDFSSRNVIGYNDINGHGDGVHLRYSMTNVISYNNMSNNSMGFALYKSNNNRITYNKISNSTGYGISSEYFSRYNRFHHNHFINNNGAGKDYNSSHTQANNSWGTNFWNDSAGGNRWSDWTGPDTNNDGIVESPYYMDDGVDLYPLTIPGTMVPEVFGFPSGLMIVLFSIFCISFRFKIVLKP